MDIIHNREKFPRLDANCETPRIDSVGIVSANRAHHLSTIIWMGRIHRAEYGLRKPTNNVPVITGTCTDKQAKSVCFVLHAVGALKHSSCLGWKFKNCHQVQGLQILSLIDTMFPRSKFSIMLHRFASEETRQVSTAYQKKRNQLRIVSFPFDQIQTKPN